MDLARGFRGLLAWGVVVLTGCAGANYEGVGRRCTSCTVEPMPTSLPPGTFVEYRIDTLYMTDLRATFTVLRETQTERWVEVRMRREARPEELLKGLYDRPLIFVMQLQPLPEGPSNPPFQTRFATDEERFVGPERLHRSVTATPMKLQVNGRTFECEDHAYQMEPPRSGRGCIRAKDPRVLFAGGVFFLEEHYNDARWPSLRIQLLDMGQRKVEASDGVIAIRSGQSATYVRSDGLSVTHTWTTGPTRVRHVQTYLSQDMPLPGNDSDWEGTLLDVVTALADKSGWRYRPLPDSNARTEVQVNGEAIRVFQRRLSDRNGGDEPYDIIRSYVDDVWQMKDAPIWIRLWPLTAQGNIGQRPVHHWLKEWK
ncbi:hypothetical protein HMI51_33690 [Corallococcus coralloides]|uniref:hypothetical protein n=1 Tax=Corallococcus sp. CA049B TaxID=2316730 RepID=UPI0011C3FE11|nr:hypothetical protein [Corallococcus sp. CA049B]NOJ97878.1 hypothetical protein [Corallococcus coralloides]